MIRKLNKDDQGSLMEYISEEPALNLFIIGDIENYGFREDFQDIWGDFNKKDEYRAVLLRYYDSFIIYAKSNYDVNRIANIIKDHKAKMVSGKKECVEELDNYLNVSQKRDTYFCKLDKAGDLYQGPLLEKVEKTKLEDVKPLWELHNRIDEFDGLDELDRKIKKYKDKTGRGYHIYDEKREKIISCAETTAENSMSAMIVGVATDQDYRNQRLASAVMSKLCEEVLNEGKELCLFYDNPSAGKIYKRIGFTDIGIWSMWSLNKEED